MGRPFRLALWLGTGGFILYVLLLGDGGWVRVAGLQSQVKQLQSQLRYLDHEQEQLRNQLEDLARPGSKTLEKVARERYGMHRENERVIHLLGTEDESLAPRAPSLRPSGEADEPGGGS